MDILFLNPIIALLHNTKLNRWHPILYLEDPLPGPPSADKPTRHKSKFHHTEGLETREAGLAKAEELIKRMIEQGYTTSVKRCLDGDMEWDGEDVPASMAFFIETDGVIRRAL